MGSSSITFESDMVSLSSSDLLCGSIAKDKTGCGINNGLITEGLFASVSVSVVLISFNLFSYSMTELQHSSVSQYTPIKPADNSILGLHVTYVMQVLPYSNIYMWNVRASNSHVNILL